MQFGKTELFSPEGWTKDKQRCDGAGVPKLDQKFQTKSELALKLVRWAIDSGIEFDFIAGDGLYRHNAELTWALDTLDQFYVLDIHKDELIFLKEPTSRYQNAKEIKVSSQRKSSSG